VSGPALGDAVRRASAEGELVVQPRMGVADPGRMAAGLRAVLDARARTVGTITLDSFTRLGDHRSAAAALAGDLPLNGYPLVSHPAETTRRVVSAVSDAMPVQVRHGSPRPAAIFRSMAEAGLAATEGGPVSYCLPYGRTPLAESVAHWGDASRQLAEDCRARGVPAHLETFGGCLMGQLCPPSLLLAIALLESLFFVECGVESLSLSYAQQTHPVQDIEALVALRALAGELLPAHVDWHVVVYTYMGVFPRSRAGARRLLDLSVDVAVRAGAERLIVKTAVEAFRIPTVAENIEALEDAAARAKACATSSPLPGGGEVDYEDVLREASRIVDAVRALADDVGTALIRAFAEGILDVPYCIHPDNPGLAQGAIDAEGRLRWARLGRVPLAGLVRPADHGRVRATEFLGMLNYVAERSDRALTGGRAASSLR
jgi:methylaspartate mutase epsilon subunit